MRVLLPIPCDDFDPTEAAVPWKILSEAGMEVVVATPDGTPANADPIVLSGKKLGILKAVLRADANGRNAYAEFHAAVCAKPTAYGQLEPDDFDALILPGGHAPKMRSYLESELLRSIIEEFFAADKVVGAICHGVVAACRALGPEGKSVLFGRKTTALTEDMELFAWRRTRKSLGDYYRTYPQTVESEVSEAIGGEGQFLCGPKPFLRDTPTKLSRGFVVEDGNYISARYPGDAHRFSHVLLTRLQASKAA
jgi:protease I